MSEKSELKQIMLKLSDKVDEIDHKLNALLVKEEPATKEELRAIKRSQKDFAAGRFVNWDDIKRHK